MWFLMVHVNFVGLTRCAPFDVFFYVLFQIWPPVVLLQECNCVAYSRVSTIWWIVKSGNYPPLKIVVAGNNQCILLPPGVVLLVQLVCVGPFFDRFLVSRLLILIFERVSVSSIGSLLARLTKTCDGNTITLSLSSSPVL